MENRATGSGAQILREDRHPFFLRQEALWINLSLRFLLIPLKWLLSQRFIAGYGHGAVGDTLP
jgi:hypothetical protein